MLKQSSFDVICKQPITFDPTLLAGGRDGSSAVERDQAAVLLCRNCSQGIVVVEEYRLNGRSWREPGGLRGGGTVTFRGIHWWPSPETQISPDALEEIASACAEAIRALQADCPRASAVMAKCTLLAITAGMGQTTGVLADRLRNLASSGQLQPILAVWAKEVRLVGNSGAHFDPFKSVSTDDAAQLIAFIQQLIHYVYDMPADLERARAARR